jgi:transposase
LIWFANGIEQDRAPVEKAFESQWSQGQTEGQVNRLKLIKRQMYGRANFDLLRARVVCGS